MYALIFKPISERQDFEWWLTWPQSAAAHKPSPGGWWSSGGAGTPEPGRQPAALWPALHDRDTLGSLGTRDTSVLLVSVGGVVTLFHVLHHCEGLASGPATHRHMVLCGCTGGQGVDGGRVAQSLVLRHWRDGSFSECASQNGWTVCLFYNFYVSIYYNDCTKFSVKASLIKCHCQKRNLANGVRSSGKHSSNKMVTVKGLWERLDQC